jgi:hypothetical protein
VLCISVPLINQPPVNIREAGPTWLLFLLKRSPRDGPGRAPGCWWGSGGLRFACGFWPPCSRLTRVAASSLSHLFSARGAPLREPSGQRPCLFRRVTTTPKQEPDSHFHPQSPRAHSKGRPPEEKYRVPNKHVADLKLHNRLPINHRRTAEGDIDSTNCHQGSTAKPGPDHVTAGQLMEDQRSL